MGAPGALAEATLLVESGTSPDGEAVPAAIHRERHIPEPAVLAVLERAGAECLDVFGINYDAILKQPLVEDRHTKAVYLARKAGRG